MVNVDSDNININDINYKKNVSHLVRAADVACRTKYSADGSSSTAYRAKQALINTFNYPGPKRHLSFAATQIRSCLENNCPVMLTGKPKCRFAGHAWIIDGYKLQNREKWERVYADAECAEYIGSKYVCDEEVYYYHCNFGWGGIADGYYLGKIFDTVSGPESREAGVDYIEDENDEANGSEAYTWMFRTVAYNNPNI